MNSPGFFRSAIRGKTRIGMAWIFAIALIFSARNYPTLPGIVVCFIGASLRFWASGFLRKDSRPAVGGPYAFTRNPLYLGTYLMALGTAMATGNWLLLAVATVAFALVYHYIILDEETKLHQIFGTPYQLYCQRVKRFIPRPWPMVTVSDINPEEAHRHFSWELATKNKAYEAYVTFAALMGFVAVVAFAWQRFGSPLV